VSTLASIKSGKSHHQRFWFVNCLEGQLCPFCRVYERGYGRKSREAGRVLWKA
jgi:dsRNA-specific ribonuclease